MSEMRRCLVEHHFKGDESNPHGSWAVVEAYFHKFFEGGAIVEFVDGHCELVELRYFKFKKYDNPPILRPYGDTKKPIGAP